MNDLYMFYATRSIYDRAHNFFFLEQNVITIGLKIKRKLLAYSKFVRLERKHVFFFRFVAH